MIGPRTRAAWPGIPGAALVIALGIPTLAPLPEAAAQRAMPVYMDDSPGAEEALGRVGDLARIGNLDEACRVLQQLLNRDADRVLPAPGEENLFISVRAAAHNLLLANPDLLDRYRALESARAASMLEADQAAEVERTRLFTRAGLEAVLTLAQRQMESARFGGAWQTLMQAEEHPDRSGTLGRACANMATQILVYMRDTHPHDAASHAEVVERWNREADIDPAVRHKVDGPDFTPVRTIYSPMPEVNLSGILPRAMASVRLGEPIEEIRTLSQEQVHTGQGDGSRLLHAAPTLVGDVVYFNDSQTISALDRFTLTPIWRAVVSSGMRPNVSFTGRAGLEDICQALHAEGRIVALTGLSLKGRTSRDRVLTCLDAATGRILWTRTTERGEAARDPGEGEFRGPVIVDEGVVVLSILREVTHQRLRSNTLVGYDLHTGERLWTRPLASVGQQSWAATPETADGSLVIDGILYRSDRIGVALAIEVQTGRIRWIRRVPRQDNGMSNDPGPWVSNIPVAHNGSIIAMSPDRQRIIEINRASGEILHSLQSGRMENPDYLLIMNNLLLGVSRDSIVGRPLRAWTVPEQSTYALRRVQGGIRGRVLVTGDSLIIPTASGIGRVDARYDADSGFTIAAQRALDIDAPGIPIVADGQLIVVDDARAHSYLSWTSADDLLRQRMDAAPTDPLPAITYAELSFRADRPDRILWATDRALRAIERDPLADDSVAARARLFTSLLDMVEPPPDAPLGAMLNTEQRDGIISRLGRLATKPDQQVAALLAAARFDEASDRPERAVERYQQILASSALSRSMARSEGTTLPAEVAATRRLERLIRIEGRRVYSAYDAEALRMLEDAARNPEANAFEQIARRYPVSRHTPRAWLQSAMHHEDAGDDRAMLFALEAGTRSAEATLDPDDPTRAELAGRLITSLIRLDRLDSAMDRIEQIAGAPILTVNDQPINLRSISDELRTRLAQQRRRADIGPELGRTWVFERLSIIEPIDRNATTTPTDRILLRNFDGTIGMWAIDDQEGLKRLWNSSIEGDLLRFDRTGVYLSAGRERNNARSVARLDIDTGNLIWRTDPIAELFARGGEERLAVAGARPRIDTPIRSGVAHDEVLAVFDRRTLVLVERSGRLAGFDLDTGRLLWAHERAPDLVHEAAAGAGLLAVIGIRPGNEDSPRHADGEAAPFENAMLLFDVRSGEPVATHRESPSQSMRWVRIDDSGLVVAGIRDGVFAYDPSRRSVVWRSDRPTLRDTVGAWFVPGGIVVLDIDTNLHLLSRQDGSGTREALDVPGRLPSTSSRVEVVTLDDEHFVVATGRNVGVFDLAGAPVGIDATERVVDTGLTPVIAEKFVITLDRASVAVGQDLRAYPLQVFELPSCRAASPTIGYELGAPPRAISALDQRLLISAGGVTIVIESMHAPDDPNAPRP